MRQSVQNYSNQNYGRRTFLENGFRATLISKANFLSVWKKHFPVLCKFLSDEIETFWWESEAEWSKLFNSKLRHKSYLSKWFWSNLKLKNECCERFKRAFFRFLQVFEWRKWNHFLRKWGKVLESILIKIWASKLPQKSVLEQPWDQNRILWAFEKSIFQVFASFWVTKLKPFPEKLRQRFKIYFNQSLAIRTFSENGFGATLS